MVYGVAADCGIGTFSTWVGAGALAKGAPCEVDFLAWTCVALFFPVDTIVASGLIFSFVCFCETLSSTCTFSAFSLLLSLSGFRRARLGGASSESDSTLDRIRFRWLRYGPSTIFGASAYVLRGEDFA